MQHLKEYKINFPDFFSQENAKLALVLNAIEPACGGVLITGKKGTGKSTILKAFMDIARFLHLPFVEVPMNVTEEALLGGIDIEETLKQGRRIYQRGLLCRANEGFLVIARYKYFPK
jgi:Mg-chelatase subunit ChlI